MRVVALTFACNNACIFCAQGEVRATSGNRGLATSGNRGLATSGNRGLATSGNRGLATSGNRGLATSGNRGLATSGNRGLATSGNRGLATSGNRGLATSGNRGLATSDDPSLAASDLNAEHEVEQAVREIARGETVAIVGGEPTLDDRLPAYVRALDAAGAGRVVVQTNGRRLAYRSYARLLRESSEKLALDVSIAGSTEAMHDYHTGTPGSFKQTVTGLRNARAEGICASVSCVITRSNFRHLADIVRLCHAVSARGVRFVLAQPLGKARELQDRVVPAPELVAPYLALARAQAEKLDFPVSVSTTGAPDEGPAGPFAGLGPVEAEADTDARIAADRLARKDVQPSPPHDVRQSLPRDPRLLPMLGRPAPARREERTPARKTGDALRAILPSLFDGSAPREVADVVAASREPQAEPPRSRREPEEIAGGTG